GAALGQSGSVGSLLRSSMPAPFWVGRPRLGKGPFLPENLPAEFGRGYFHDSAHGNPQRCSSVRLSRVQPPGEGTKDPLRDSRNRLVEADRRGTGSRRSLIHDRSAVLSLRAVPATGRSRHGISPGIIDSGGLVNSRWYFPRPAS